MDSFRQTTFRIHRDTPEETRQHQFMNRGCTQVTQEIKEFADPMRRCGRVEDGYPGKSRAGVKDVRPRVGVGVENVNRRRKCIARGGCNV